MAWRSPLQGGVALPDGCAQSLVYHSVVPRSLYLEKGRKDGAARTTIDDVDGSFASPGMAEALIAQLSLEDDLIEFPPAATGWELDDIQTFFDTCGAISPPPGAPKAPPPPPPVSGGTREQPPPIAVDPRADLKIAAAGGWVSDDPADLTSAGYARIACACGVPDRAHGLFGPRDAAPLLELQGRPGARPFQKHLWDTVHGRWALAADSFVAGDQAAAERGIDLRYLHVARELHGVLRFNEKATIGAALLMSCHGGAVEAVLDEVTAELMKIQHSPNTVTSKMLVEIKKPVPAFETLMIECKYLRERGDGLVIIIQGLIKAQDGTVLAKATADMVDLNKMK